MVFVVTVCRNRHPFLTIFLRDAILRTDYAGQIAVLHCRSGTAQAICAAVDAKQDHRIVGTIAGDDTIFILLRSEEQAAFFRKAICSVDANRRRGNDMLNELYIENLAVIERASIPFSQHFNVFTGETGAGKSILIHGINAVLGQRVTKDFVRTGCKRQSFLHNLQNWEHLS